MDDYHILELSKTLILLSYDDVVASSTRSPIRGPGGIDV
jgi:hypothetical protein